LQQLGIPNASFVVQHEHTSDYTAEGIDEVNFLFSANKNEREQDISVVASGGELSRLMMSLKYILSQNKALPTIIFDEIDSGVSGEIAYKMGNMLRGMAENMQVINITHLPQIAGKGDHHYLVYKQDDDAGTHTFIKKLSEEERITEIAKMLSGEQLTDAAVDNAKQLLVK
jgi:DNA repair protein RecN (Recombination protein N)